MAKRETKPTGAGDVPALSGAEQVDAMTRLNQQAAAWLVGRNGRSLRNNPTVPRNADGTYSGQALVAWAARRLGDVELDDDEMETALVISAEIMGAGFDLGEFVAYLGELENRHGDAGLVAFLRTLLAEGRRDVEDDPGAHRAPTPAELRERIEEIEQREAERLARARFDVAVVCETCKRLRRGRQWVKAKPPAGFAVVLAVCPRCESR